MKRISHLQKFLLLSAAILLLSIGNPFWWRFVSFVCYTYYGFFVINLFLKMYESENMLTRTMLGNPNAPMVVGFIVLIIAIVVKKMQPDLNVEELYLCAVASGIPRLIARIKTGRLQRR